MRHDNNGSASFNKRMKLDLLTSLPWEDWNEAFRPHFKIQLDEQGRMYRGLAHAVNELVLGTAMFYSHKNSVTVIQGETWAFEAVMPHLYKLGFQVHETPRSQMTDWKSFVEALPPETNFVLWAEDHPLTGAFEDRTELDKLLAAKRIISISVSHSSHLFRARALSPYSMRLCSLTNDLCWATLGSRLKIPPLFAHRMEWTEAEQRRILDLLSRLATEDQQSVQTFEAKVIGLGLGFQAVPFAADRLWDRAVLLHPDLNAEALQTSLGLSQGAVVTCAQRSLPEFRTWWKPLPDDDFIRGLLILGHESLKSGELLQSLPKAVAESRFRLG